MTARILAAAVLLALIVLSFMVGRSSASRPSPNTTYPESAWTRIGAPEYVSRSVESHPADRKVPLAGAPSPSPEPTTRSPALGHTVAQAKAYALRILGAVQYACLDAVVMHESKWNPLARNPVSGAFGIPQALHGLTSTDPLTQIRWMLDYVARRYGTACAAWAHVQRFGWY